jgi:hypothetical protein
MPIVFEAPEAPAARAYRRLATSLESELSIGGAAEFEWVDPESGTSQEPGPVMEVPLETLIEEAGLSVEDTERNRVVDRVRSWLDG